MPTHLVPSRPLATDALIPGDPGRAMAIAQQLMVKPLMSNHNRGLWGYTGETAGGHPITVQSTGMGAPSAAIVLHELHDLGVRRAIRVGTCGALDPSLELGTVVRVEAALPDDGVSRALGAEGPQHPDPALDALLAEGETDGSLTVVTTDLFYEYDLDPRPGWIADGAAAVEMEACPLFTLGPRLGVAVAALLIVSDVFPDGEHVRIDSEALEAAVERMARAAGAALEAG